MSRLADGRLVLLGILLFCRLSVAEAAARRAAQAEPTILHKAVECWPRDQFLMLGARFQPGLEIMAAKVYFRSDKYPDFYYVDLKVDPTGGGQAVMPKASPETASIIYYLEAVTRAYSSGRSAEFDPEVTDSGECRRRDPLAAWFTGDSPGIVVGATRIGAAAIPPGFEAAGITGFINAAGVAGGVGGGLGAAPVLVAVGAAGATAGVVAAGQQGATTSSATNSVPAATTSSSVTTTTPAVTSVPVSAAPLACFTTTPSPPIIQEGESIRFDASCSKGDSALRADAVVNYSWDFGNGKVVEGPDRRVVNTLYTERGRYEVRLSVRDEAGNVASTSRGVTVEAPPTTSTTTTVGPMADLVVKKTASPDPATESFSLTYEVTVLNKGPSAATGVKVVDTLPSTFKLSGIDGPSCTSSGLTVTCNLGTLPVEGTVKIVFIGVPSTTDTLVNKVTVSGDELDPDLNSNEVTLSTKVVPVVRLDSDELDTGFASFLGVASFGGSAGGRVSVNGAVLAETDNTAPFQHRLAVRAGANEIEACLTSDGDRGGFWRFDFGGAPHFVAGSIAREQGEVVSLDAYAVVFSVGGARECVKFRFQVRPD